MSATVTPSASSASFLGANPSMNRLYDNIQALVPGISLPVLQMEAWNTIEDFYIRSTARRAEIEFQMAIGVNQIDLNPYDETWLVAWVLSVHGIHHPKIIPPATIIDRFNPTALRQGRALLALKPVSFNTALPEDLFSNWFEFILAGTLSRLHSQIAKPYSNPQAAAAYGKRFNHGINRARDTANRGYSEGPSRWHFPYFSRGREMYWR